MRFVCNALGNLTEWLNDMNAMFWYARRFD